MSRADKEEQISRDVPRTSYRIAGEDFGCAMGEDVDANIREKMVREIAVFVFEGVVTCQ